MVMDAQVQLVALCRELMQLLSTFMRLHWSGYSFQLGEMSYQWRCDNVVCEAHGASRF